MTAGAVAPEDLQRVRLERLRELKLCGQHPAHLSRHVTCIDRKSGEVFRFEMTDEGAPWYWQREYLDWLLEHDMTITLKGRQLGVTWVECLEALWYLLFKPGSAGLGYSINEDEAKLLVGRLWDMFESLPTWIKGRVTVVKPARGRPSTTVELQHPDGRISSFTGMVSTESAGHGRTAALVLLDEFAWQKYAPSIWKAVLPTLADGGRVRVISTANGVSVE
jgi:hypothetical protein